MLSLRLLFLLVPTLGSLPSSRLMLAALHAGGGHETPVSKHALPENPEQPGVQVSPFTFVSRVTEYSSPATLESYVAASNPGPAKGGLDALPGLLRAAAEACWQLLRYYGGHVPLMNKDSVFGIRIAEGYFYLGLLDLAAGARQQDAGARRAAMALLRRLLDESLFVGGVAEAHAKQKGYNRKKKGLLLLLREGFMRVRLDAPPLTEVTHTPELVLLGSEKLNSFISDTCLNEVATKADCVITRPCWEVMTARNNSGYSLTHQFIYVLAAVQTGCEDRLNHLLAVEGEEGGVGAVLARMCSAVLAESRVIADAGFPEYRRDLFLEQGALCGLLGYQEFFPEAWVRQVLLWQKPEGCYGFGDSRGLISDTPAVHPQDSHRRVRRDERYMTGNCLAHLSAVALGYLAGYTRFAAVNASFPAASEPHRLL